MSNDVNAAIAFYSEVTGWKTEPFDKAYTMWTGSQGPLGGVMKHQDKSMPPSWMASVQVEDVDATAKLAKERGGKIYMDPFDVPEVGRFAVIADPQGVAIGIFSSKGERTAHEIKEGEFCWNELMTTDLEAAFAFHSEVFGWKVVQDMDIGAMGKYRIFGAGDKQLGGMMKAPAGPPMWIHYIETNDLDAALGRATSKGAKVINGPMEVPSGGRIVQLTDPQGAIFALNQSPKK
jgi:predicted enzyme related to lactoylglutathione lyase